MVPLHNVAPLQFIVKKACHHKESHSITSSPSSCSGFVASAAGMSLSAFALDCFPGFLGGFKAVFFSARGSTVTHQIGGVEGEQRH